MPRLRHNRGWHRRGFALLWDYDVLASFAHASEVISLRQFFAMANDWPEELPSSNGNTVVVSGVEGCLDVLNSEDAESWIENDLRQAMLQFQSEYQGDGGLVFWLASGRTRIKMKGATESYFYKHSGTQGEGLQIGRLLWSGAESEVERIIDTENTDVDCDGPHWAGLHHPRIS